MFSRNITQSQAYELRFDSWNVSKKRISTQRMPTGKHDLEWQQKNRWAEEEKQNYTYEYFKIYYYKYGFFPPFGNKTLLEEVMKTMGAGALEMYE